MEPFCNIVKWASMQWTLGHGPKVLEVLWSKSPSSGHIHAAARRATETLLLV